MSKVHYRGGCLCGAVRLEVAAEPYRVGICHCLDCRKHHGAMFGTFAIFPADAVSITGTTAEIGIAAGAFDAPNQVTPTYELWICRRENWLPPFDVARRYERDREGTGRSEP